MSTPLAPTSRTSAPVHPTRQQLDELDALLQRMLDLPVNQLEEAVGPDEVAAPPAPPAPPRPAWGGGGGGARGGAALARGRRVGPAGGGGAAGPPARAAPRGGWAPGGAGP